MKVHSFFNIHCTRCTGGPKGGPGERAKEPDEGAVSSLLGPGGAEAGSYFESHQDSESDFSGLQNHFEVWHSTEWLGSERKRF